jgi:hypothetical protein
MQQRNNDSKSKYNPHHAAYQLLQGLSLRWFVQWQAP